MSQNLFPGDLAQAQGGVHAPRRAALLLHAMSEADQRWMLDQLPEPEAATLRSLLVELHELGIPADRTLLGDVIATTPQAPVSLPVREHSEGDLLGELEGADPLLLGQALKDEPAGLIAHLLDLHPWPWTEALLRQLTPLKRSQVETQRTYSGAPLPPDSALRKHLVKRFHGRMASVHPVLSLPAQDPGPGDEGPWWQRALGAGRALLSRGGSQA